MRQDELQKVLITFHRSNDAHDYVDYSRKPGWLDHLPMDGLEDFRNLLEAVWRDIGEEMKRRDTDHLAHEYRKAIGIND